MLNKSRATSSKCSIYTVGSKCSCGLCCLFLWAFIYMVAYFSYKICQHWFRYTSTTWPERKPVFWWQDAVFHVINDFDHLTIQSRVYFQWSKAWQLKSNVFDEHIWTTRQIQCALNKTVMKGHLNWKGGGQNYISFSRKYLFRTQTKKHNIEYKKGNVN